MPCSFSKPFILKKFGGYRHFFLKVLYKSTYSAVVCILTLNYYRLTYLFDV